MTLIFQSIIIGSEYKRLQVIFSVMHTVNLIKTLYCILAPAFHKLRVAEYKHEVKEKVSL